MVLGGSVSTNAISSIELFPPSDACTIPPLPQPRGGHSLSLLSGGRLVVCGGFDQMKLVNTFVLRPALNTCISWVAGNTSWTLLYNMRCLPTMPQKHISIPQWGENLSHGLGAAISSWLYCVARWWWWCWWRWIRIRLGRYCASTARYIKAHLSTVKQCCTFYSFLPDGGRFSMKHKIWDGCGIPDGETIVMTGSGSTQSHTHVTRYATECATSTALIAQGLFV